MPIKTKPNQTGRGLIVIILFSVLTVAAYQFNEGRIILYPFTLLATWFHEMGHGLAALILGGDFLKLEIMSDGSGYAIHTGAVYLPVIGNAFISFAGLIGPSIAGSFLILASKNEKSSLFVSFFLALIMAISILLWVRSIFAVFIMLLWTLALVVLPFISSGRFGALLMQLLGVQAFASLYLNMGYLFIQGGTVDGQTFTSDTGVIEQSLFLPYWIWGGLTIAVSLTIIVVTFMLYKKKH